MSEYDGSITLSVGLEAADVKRAASQLQKEIENIFKLTAGQQTTKEFDRLATTMSRLSAQAEQVKAKMEKLEETRIPTDDYQSLSKELDKTVDKIASLQKKLDGLEGSRKKGVQAMRDKLSEEIKQMESQYRAINKELIQMREDGTAWTSGKDTEQYKRLQDQLNNINNQMRLAIEKANEMQDPPVETEKAFSRLNSSVARVASGVKKLASTIARLSVAGIKKLANGFVAVGKKVVGVTKKIAGIGGHLNAQDLSLKKIIKKVAMYALGIQTVMSLMNKLRGYATNALKAMAKQFDEVDVKISGIVNSFNQFKNSIGTIVEPLLNLFAPAIEKIIQGMTAMSNKIANFVAVFTGQEYIYKATKSNKKYSQSLKDTASAAKEANKELGNYDELLVIQQQNQKSDDGSGASEPLFEKVAVQPSGFAASLKDMITGGDWAGIGKELATKLNNSIAGINANGIASTIADKINKATSLVANFLTTFSFTGLGEKIGGALSTFLTTINWENIAVSIGASMKGKFDFITSFLDSMDWEGITTNIINGFKKVNWVQVAQSLIKALKTALSSAIKIINTLAKEIDGRKLGEDVGTIFNDIVTSIGELIEEVEWDELASDIGGFLSEALNNINWGELWKTTTSLVAHLFDALSTIISEINWEELGHNLYEGFTSIDYGELFKSIFHFVGVAIGGLGQLIGTFIMDGIADMWLYFEKQINDAGGNIVEGILYGICEALTNIGKWLYDNVFKPIWDGICEVFGIASPSKKMEEIGGFVVDGFLAAFDGLKKAICAIFNAALNVIRIPINMIIGFVNTMIGAVESGINFIIDALNKLHWKAPDWLGGWEFGFNFSHVSFWKIPEIPEAHFGEDIPALAKGAVIPPNSEFLAILGDQKNGTNIETPLDTMLQAFNVALDSRGSRQNQPIVLQLNGRTVAQAVWDEEEKRYRQTGSYRPNFA